MGFSARCACPVFALVSALLLLLLSCSGAAAYMTAPRSPQGVDTMQHHLLFTDVGHPDEFCQNVTYRESDIFQSSRLWTYSALRPFAAEVFQRFRALSTLPTRALLYQDVEAKAEPTAVPPLQFLTSCVARRMILDKHTVSQAMCVCLSGLKQEGQCPIMDAFARSVYCLDSVAAKINPSVFCPTTHVADAELTLSESCSGSVAPFVSAQSLDLYSLYAHARVPDMIDPHVVAQEGRAYYLASKALERLSRWTDSHLFCHTATPGPPLDIELLPTWKSILYFSVHSQEGYIPLAVLAQRQNTANATRNFERFLLVIRDARTTREAQMAATSRLSRKMSLAGLEGFVHAGFDTAASAIIAGASARLDQFFTANADQLWEPRLTVVGGGAFGSGVATIVSRDLAHMFQFAPGTYFRVQHDLIVFESGGVGNYEFTEDLRQNVNVRNVVSDSSPFSNLPCTSPAACGRSFAIRTGDAGETIGPFIPLPGRVQATTREVGGIWAAPEQPAEVVANAVCATPCWLTTTFCLDDPESRCTATACGAFFTKETA